MTAEEVAKLKVGDKVVWPEGANGCAKADGIVCRDGRTDSLYIAWDDGERTYSLDRDAIQYVERIQEKLGQSLTSR